METEKIAVMIPIIFLLVTGLVLSLIVYYNFRSKQILIQKAGSLEEYKKIMESEQSKNPKGLLKTGIVLIFIGIGIGFGVMMDEQFGLEYMVPLIIFASTGIGLILAHKAGEAKPEVKTE